MNRKAWQVMQKLIGLVMPLLHIMILAVSFGVIGYLCAIFITILASIAFVKMLGFTIAWSYSNIITGMIICAVARGILRYIEQASNHYIAFKLLAILRHKIFVKLRTLAPAKLEGKDKGNLISLITSDIELLEVFYAHTISPIMIAIVVSMIMVIYIGQYHIVLGIVAFVFYVIIGAILPIQFGKKGAIIGQNYRDDFGKMNGFVLDSLRGIKESMQYGHGFKRLEEMNLQTDSIEDKQKELKKLEGQNFAYSDMAVLLAGMTVLLTSCYLYMQGIIGFDGIVITTIAMLSSVGPVVALSNLSNNLHHTIASGNRVLDLLEEEPLLKDITGKEGVIASDLTLEHVTFGYDQEKVVEDISLAMTKNQIIGIHGKSGSGKSTLLKLIMRFWQVDKGNIHFGNRSIEDINTTDLRDVQSYVVQDTYLFNDTLANNIALAKHNATMEEIETAAKKASIHDFIIALPEGYQTRVGELGGRLSGGQKQRIGIARAFLHNAPMILLDEPTSNLDSLNEAVILQSLVKEKEDKMIILVSHRKSTMSIVDKEYHMDSSRIS